MNKTRISLDTELKQIIGQNLYFQPPSSVFIKYPAIIYSLEGNSSNYANNGKYSNSKRYTIILIDKNPDSLYVDEILKLPYCQLDRTYQSDGMNYFAFTINI